jgi:hypothetical protein
MINKKDIKKAQEAWGNAIIQIGSLKEKRTECLQITEVLLEKLYGFEKAEILFKPTRAFAFPFRPTKEAAISYFIGGNKNFPNDDGFALQPWEKIRFENSGIILEDKRAIAMGHYFFTDFHGNEIKVEYTFGYFKNDKGELKIDLHHSSIPFKSNK